MASARGGVDLGRRRAINEWAIEPLDENGSGWFAVATRGEVSVDTRLEIDPIGPLPHVLGISHLEAKRSHYSTKKVPMDPDRLAAALAGFPCPTDAEALEQTSGSANRVRRARSGAWVIQDSVFTPRDEQKAWFEARVQCEEGGTHAAFVSGRYGPNEWGELTIEVIGAAASRREVVARLQEWATETGWTLLPRWESDPA